MRGDRIHADLTDPLLIIVHPISGISEAPVFHPALGARNDALALGAPPSSISIFHT